MKKILLVFIFMCIMNMLLAPKTGALLVFIPPEINYYNPLIRAINLVEVGDGSDLYNEDEQAVGYFQIRPIRLADYNSRTGKMYQMSDLYNYDISKEIFLYYTNGRSYEKVAKSWNGSGPKTISYWKKVKSKL